MIKKYILPAVLVIVLVLIIIWIIHGNTAQNEEYITAQEAEKLCGEVMGEVAEETGFPVSYRCQGAVSVGGKFYYVMHVSWLVDNSHWSYIGNCFVSCDGREIYDGIVSEKEYKITKLLWSR